MTRHIIFELSGTSDTEYQAALAELSERIADGWNLTDATVGDGTRSAGCFQIQKGTLKRTILFDLSAETLPEFEAAVTELHAKISEGWSLTGAEREVETNGRIDGELVIEKQFGTANPNLVSTTTLAKVAKTKSAKRKI